MDIATGLTYTGSYIGGKPQPPEALVHNNKVPRTNIPSANIYQARNLGVNRRHVRKKANTRYRKSAYPMSTGLVPNFYNQQKAVTKSKKEAVRRGMLKERLEARSSDKKNAFIEPYNNQASLGSDSVFSDYASTYGGASVGSASVDNNHMAFYNRANRIKDNKRFEGRIPRSGPGFLKQFEQPSFNNPGDPVSSNNVHHIAGSHGAVDRIELERDMALKGEYSKFNKQVDMTYDAVPKQYRSMHNNMVPYFGSGIGKGYGPNSLMQQKYHDNVQRKLDTFTGSIKNIEYRPKTERRPLFNPHVGLTWIYGSPNFTDYYETRYIPGRERRNEKPFQEVRITPGLNLGYHEISKQGFHDTWRPLPKTTDELRVASNPKISYGRPVITGMKGTRRPIAVPVHKRRPVRFRENDIRDLTTQKGNAYYRGPAIYGNYDAPHTNRQQTSKAWGGPAKFVEEALHKPQSLYPYHKISHKENWLHPSPRNITGVDRNKNTSYTEKGYYARPTERMTTQHRTYVNPAGPEYKKHHAFDMVTNIPDPTLRDTTQNRTWVNPAHAEWKKHYAFDMHSNIPDPTIRDTTQNKTYQGPINPHEMKRGGYGPEHFGTIAPSTLRQLHQKNTYQGQANHSALNRGSHQINVQNTVAPTTLRQLHQKNTYQGQANHSALNRGSHQINVQNTVAPTTMRQLHQKNTYQGQANHSALNRGSHQIAVQNTVAPTTMRQLHQKNTYQGQASHSALNRPGHIPALSGTIAPTTLRQLTQKNTQNRAPHHSALNKPGYIPALSGTIAPTTLRQLTQKNTQNRAPNNAALNKPGHIAALGGTRAPTTLRQLTQHTTYQRPVGTQDREKPGHIVAHQNTVAKPTMRQQMQHTTYQRPVGTQEREKPGHTIAHQNTVAKPTMRQQTQHTTYQRPVGTQEREKPGHIVAHQNTVAPTTLRQLTQNKTYINPAHLHEGGKQRGRADANNSLVNVAKDQATIVRDGGAPTTCNYEKIPVMDGTMVNLCEPIQIRRDVYGQMYGQRPLQCIPTAYTRVANVLPQHSWRFDTCVTENLKGNPYVNNTQNRSVVY